MSVKTPIFTLSPDNLPWAMALVETPAKKTAVAAAMAEVTKVRFIVCSC
jgi:hypothetical protein